MPESGPTLRIREARPEDAERLVPLFRTFYDRWFGETFTHHAVAKRIRGASGFETVYIAESGDRIAGFASLRLVPSLDPAPHAEVTDLFVDPPFRRHGVGAALLAHSEVVARDRGATQVIVLTGTMNADAIAFYRAAGYADYAVAFNKRLRD